MRGSRKCTDNIMRGAVELVLQFRDGERDAEKVDRVARPG